MRIYDDFIAALPRLWESFELGFQLDVSPLQREEMPEVAAAASRPSFVIRGSLVSPRWREWLPEQAQKSTSRFLLILEYEWGRLVLALARLPSTEGSLKIERLPVSRRLARSLEGRLLSGKIGPALKVLPRVADAVDSGKARLSLRSDKYDESLSLLETSPDSIDFESIFRLLSREADDPRAILVEIKSTLETVDEIIEEGLVHENSSFGPYLRFESDAGDWRSSVSQDAIPHLIQLARTSWQSKMVLITTLIFRRGETKSPAALLQLSSQMETASLRLVPLSELSPDEEQGIKGIVGLPVHA